MLVTTTHNVEGKRIVEYKGLVAGEAILGANLFRDLFASIRDIVGGRSGSYEKVLNDARKTAVSEMTDMAAGDGCWYGSQNRVTINRARSDSRCQQPAPWLVIHPDQYPI
jgi:hypothetical protein